ncbi:MAG: sigma-54-dependent Fis family transcriptional regulator [Candidatus Saganbacteria bacterium]|nr:sigma-54-dependent Fis family transcriptional regulator [Candidatus Saganbacteria bacterium]
MPPIKPLILAVDDETDMLETYSAVLSKKYQVLTVESAAKALNLIKSEPVSIVLLDVRMPRIDGLTALKRIKELKPELNVIMVTASKDIASAVDAMKAGAFDYVGKPFDVAELHTLIEKALERKELSKEDPKLSQSLKQTPCYCGMVGGTAEMQRLFQMIERVAPSDSTVLINGESGTGKELVARAIHQKSGRAGQPFVAINCAALPENLLESELFGHERGAFTGALERKPGKFEQANQGTLFLDEIGCMAPPMQAKLLRVLETRSIERIGGTNTVPVDVRIVSATNINFDSEIRAGKFRHDLYYRLNVIPLDLPPLRQRKEDLPLFIDHFLANLNRRFNKQITGLEPAALLALKGHDWPGNVRELQNLMERCVVLATERTIKLSDLPQLHRNTSAKAGTLPENGLKNDVEIYERQLIQQALDQSQGNISQAAKALKMARTSLLTRMRSLKMNSPS